ncbi:RsmF rRNA methyltransferase first C-terminal domain-containing protein [Butyrivibrio sp. XB500-5]|uniref:RsmF rRNA methyltransferase first C-terminal domain-containing protein n=1 Tax=Butyrivibrio sp. XB500-5 TaxID=2364880 RepID=UPI0018F47201|nr:RsmF rRNA methyltransferase first C-terminal domain-containing protein [Butyrivibrio sp. XB500-5]
MLPDKFKERMKQFLGEEEYNAFITAFEEDRRYYALRANTLKCDVSFIKNLPYITGNIPWEETGFYYAEDATPGKHPYHEAGLYYIQEPSAMAPVSYLNVQPGDKILDLCAAPGGKTTQIACKLKGQGLLVTNEINKDRAKILSLNIERLGIANAMVLNETPQHLSEVFEGYFDKILIDAPCSGEGMFRKNDNAADEWSVDNVLACAKRQAEILDLASKMLLPGGRIVYSTCTFSKEENEDNIYAFVNRHPDFKEVDRRRLWPHKDHGEGHFLCVLERDGELVNDGNRYIPGGKNVPVKKDVLKPFYAFCDETLKKGVLEKLMESKNIIMFGKQLFLEPTFMPSVNGLKVLRTGLHLGEIIKDRFEPNHALALFLRTEDVNASFDLPSDSADIKAYLNGQTLRITEDIKKGWCLVTTDGYSIGWGKASGGMIKNHYPKGLRINY